MDKQGARVIRVKATGEVVCETWQTVPEGNLKPKFEIVPVLQHLQEINTPGTIAYRRARGYK